MKFIRKGISEKEKDMIGIQARKIKWCKKCNTPQIKIDGKYFCLVCDSAKKAMELIGSNKGGKDAITK